MPTGYTYDIETGELTSAKEFILRCARNFGALAHMRENNLNTDIKLREVDDYYYEKLIHTKMELERLDSISDIEIMKNIEKRYLERIKERKEAKERYLLENKRYNEMLHKVKKWEIPNDDFRKLKEFAIDQINISKTDIKFIEEYCNLDDIKKETVNEYSEYARYSLLKDIERYSREYADEVKRVEECNKWIKDLISSLENID